MELIPRVLHGNATQAFSCSWNPTSDHLATGCDRGIAEIWDMTKNLTNTQPGPLALFHSTGDRRPGLYSVSSIEWSRDGTRLLTGSNDRIARIWTSDGRLSKMLDKHKSKITRAKWNKNGDYVVTCGDDKSSVVWDVKLGDAVQTFKFHKTSVLDVDWKSDDTFASSSSDKKIFVCKVGKMPPFPERSLTGHEGDVNAIQWDPSGEFLASCSNDKSVRVWDMSRSSCLLNLEEAHRDKVFTIRWSPTGPASTNPNADLILASASYDSTVKLWDVNSQSSLCSHALSEHEDVVYAIAFSHDGKYLASGSSDRLVCIWSVADGSLVRSYCAAATISDVSWNQRGDKLAACSMDGTVHILELRK